MLKEIEIISKSHIYLCDSCGIEIKSGMDRTIFKEKDLCSKCKYKLVRKCKNKCGHKLQPKGNKNLYGSRFNNYYVMEYQSCTECPYSDYFQSQLVPEKDIIEYIESRDNYDFKPGNEY